MVSLTAFSQTTMKAKKEKHVIIKAIDEVPGDINQTAIDKLDEPLKAIAAYYSGLGGSNCRQDTNLVETCDLTTALGLGNQGSEQHKALLKKWFPNDKAAEQLIAQDCYQGPSGASSFSDYVYLILYRQGNTVTIDFNLMVYNRGDIKYIKGPDKILITGNTLKVLKGGVWQRL